MHVLKINKKIHLNNLENGNRRKYISNISLIHLNLGSVPSKFHVCDGIGIISGEPSETNQD